MSTDARHVIKHQARGEFAEFAICLVISAVLGIGVVYALAQLAVLLLTR
jgi:hypothetical protein